MRNLILIRQGTKQDRADYEEIARRIGARAPDVAVFIVDTKEASCHGRRSFASLP